MAVTNRLKPLADVPVWEWLRPAISSSVDVSGFASQIDGRGRYIYYVANTVFQRYDTQTDGWQHLRSTMPISQSRWLEGMTYRSEDGFFGTALSSTNNTIQAGALNGKIFVGNTIRIIDGPGAGQERTITSASSPLILDRFVMNAVTNSIQTQFLVTDSTKKWKPNQWRNCQCRIQFGTGQQYTVRNILWNNNDTLCLGDNRLMSIDPYKAFGTVMLDATAPSASCNGTVEYNSLTVNQNWTTLPNSSSRFVIKSGGVYVVGSANNVPYTVCYYDVAADTFYGRHAFHSQMPSASVPAGASLTSLDISSGSFSGSTVYVNGYISNFLDTRSVELNSGSMSFIPNQYAWYKFKQQNGTDNTILSNTTSSVTFTRDVLVTGSLLDQWSIVPDYDKSYMIGNSSATLVQHNSSNDSWYICQHYDYGISNQLCAFFADNRNRNSIIPILGISASGNIATFYTAVPHFFKDGDLISIRGAVGSDNSKYNVTNVIFTGSNFGFTMTGSSPPQTGSYVMSGTPGTLNAQPSASSVATMSDASKNWNVNEHAGKICQIWNTTSSLVSEPFSKLIQAALITGNSSTTLHFASASASVGVPQAFSAPLTASNGDFWAYNILDNKQLGTYIPLGTGSVYFSGSTSGSQTFIFNVSGAFDHFITELRPTYPVTTSNASIGPETMINGMDLFSNPATASINCLATGSNTTSSVMTCSLDSTVGYGHLREGNVLPTIGTVYDRTKQWALNLFGSMALRIIAGSGTASFDGLINTNTAANPPALTVNSLVVSPIFTGGIPNTGSVFSIVSIRDRQNGTGLIWVASGSNLVAGKYLYSWRAGGMNMIERYNISTNQWENVQPSAGHKSENMGTGSMYVYDGGSRIYFTKDTHGIIDYLNVEDSGLNCYGTVPSGMGSAINGNRMAILTTSENIKYLYVMRHSDTVLWRSIILPTTQD